MPNAADAQCGRCPMRPMPNAAEAYLIFLRKAIVDFNPYSPSYGAPAAFIATTIFNGSEFLGVLAFQLPVDKINIALQKFIKLPHS